MPDNDLERTVKLDALVAAVWPEGTSGSRVSDKVERFQTVSPEWWDSDRVFGGMVVAQALGAALQTVDSSLPPHSLHGYFLRPTRPGDLVTQTVDRVRDGRAFSVRQVLTEVGDKPVFSMTCSFHRPETGDEYQLPMPEVPSPEEVERVDLPIPLDIRELGPTHRREDGSYESTRRVWLRTSGPITDDLRVHACVLAYLSDMTGAAFRPHSLGTWGGHTDASLDHALWFHQPVRVDCWLLFDLQAVVNSAGRATVRGLLFDQAGQLCASMAQELLIRPLDEPVEQRVPAWGTSSDGTSSEGTPSEGTSSEGMSSEGNAGPRVDPTRL